MKNSKVLFPESYIKPLGDFVAPYIEIESKHIKLYSERVVLEAIFLLISNELFTPRTMMKAIYEMYDVFVPSGMINEWFTYWNDAVAKHG